MNALIRLLRRLVWRRMTSVPVTDAEIAALAQKLLPIVQQHRQREYAAAVKYIESAMPMIQAAPIRPYKVEAIEKVIEEATAPSIEVPKPAKASPRPRLRVKVTETPPAATLDPQSRRQARVRVRVTEANRTDPAVTRVVADRVGATLARHAKQAGREAISDTADRAGEIIGWARVLTGEENCGFCAMLASRGPIYSSEKAARFRGGQAVDAYHDHCDCEVVLVRKGQDWKGRAEYERLEDLWATSTAGLSGKDALKAFTAAYNGDTTARDTGDSSARPAAGDTKPPASAAETPEEIAQRHLPGLRASLQRLREKGLAEDSAPVQYHLQQIAKFEAALPPEPVDPFEGTVFPNPYTLIDLGRLTDDEIGELKNYAIGGYQAVNDALRGKLDMTDDIAERIGLLRSAIAKFPAERAYRVSRSTELDDLGLTLDDLHEGLIGDVLSDKAFLSTSGFRNPPHIRKRENPVILDIAVPEGTPAVQITDQLTLQEMADRERELLLPDSALLMIVGLNYDVDVASWRIQAQVLPAEGGDQP